MNRMKRIPKMTVAFKAAIDLAVIFPSPVFDPVISATRPLRGVFGRTNSLHVSYDYDKTK